MDIRSNPEQIDPAWMTNVLQARCPGCEVTGLSGESIGTGQVGENVRFTLTGHGVPPSVVGKFPSLDPVSKQTGILQRNYVREVFFYQSLQETVNIQTPLIYHAEIDPASHEFVLLMEDLAPGVQGDQLQGCSVDQAALALEQLAHLQGPKWGDEALAKHDLLLGSTDRQDSTMITELYKGLMPGYLDRYGAQLTDGEVAATEQLLELIPTYQALYGNKPPVLIHVDYRLDNMMFGGPYPLTVVDWQSLTMGCPLNDVSYFMGTSLLGPDRDQEEAALIRHYLGVLKSYGVDLKFDDAFAYYRNYAPAGMIMALIASMIVGETERGNDMFMVMAKRSIEMSRSLGVLN